MPTEKILIVDDEPMIRWTLHELLSSWGYVVSEAKNGAEAIAVLIAVQPTAVLLDINLPDSSGLELLREIKSRQPQAAVIMVTADTVYDNAVAALRNGADDFIGKPINVEELRFALQKAIDGKQQQAVTIPKLRLLIVAEGAERLKQAKTLLGKVEAEFTGAITLEELQQVCPGEHDIVIVDASPPEIPAMLKTLRATHHGIPVLVNNSSLAHETSLVGVLPQYRAMSCSPIEISALVTRRIAALTRHASR